jgi:hypothetical protein
MRLPIVETLVTVMTVIFAPPTAATMVVVPIRIIAYLATMVGTVTAPTLVVTVVVQYTPDFPVMMGSPAPMTAVMKMAMCVSMPPMTPTAMTAWPAPTIAAMPAPVVRMLPIMPTVITAYGVTEKRPVMRFRIVRPALLPIVMTRWPAPTTVVMKVVMFVSILPMTPTVTMVSTVTEPRLVMPSPVVRKELRRAVMMV